MKYLLNQRTLFMPAILVSAISCFLCIQACQEKTVYYAYGDFMKVPKTDVHLHINSLDRRYMELADSFNFRVVSPNVDSRIPVDEQLITASAIRKEWPDRFAFLGTFSVDSFGMADFAEKTISRIKECMLAGASGIKIWKNIGMVLKDKEGKYVMIDDPAFDPVFRYLEENKIPVMGHLGEPKNCWLPLEEMTDSANARYFRANPKYHMYLHPEAPSYEGQIDARDNLLRKHPGLDFTGAHLASLEWSVDELAKRLDLYPNLKVDVSARMAHLQYQSISDHERVRNFMIRYQDRILYGTDITINVNEANPDVKSQMLLDRWKSNWIYLATDSTIKVKDLTGMVKGLHLPKEIIDKIYNKNAGFFFLKQDTPPEIFKVTAQAETEPVPRNVNDDSADDPAIWVNPFDPDSSCIIGTDKKGGLAVYNLNGIELYYYKDGNMNNADLRHGFALADKVIDILAVNNRINNSLILYKINRNGSLEKVNKRELISELSDEVYGLCMYKSPHNGKYYVFMNNKFGDVEQWELFAHENLVDGKIVRKLKLASQVEGMVADDEASALFVGEEDAGIWKFTAEPDSPVEGTKLVKSSESENENIRFDIEGLAIYKLNDGNGYLISSSQGNDSYAIFQRESPHQYLGSFRVVERTTDGIEGTDGLDVTNIPLGKNFPAGMLVIQDGSNNDGGKPAAQNYKLVRWDSVAVRFTPPLESF